MTTDEKNCEICGRRMDCEIDEQNVHTYDCRDCKEYQNQVAELTNYIPAERFQEIESFIEWNAPTPELFIQAKSLFKKKQVYSNSVEEWNESVLIRQALICAYQQLTDIRHNGIGTHALGHAKATLFQKTLALYCGSLYQDDFMNELIKQVNKYNHFEIEEVEKVFQPIYETLVGIKKPNHHRKDEDCDHEREFNCRENSLDKRQKELLLRAFWHDFETRWERFLQFDPRHFAMVLYHSLLKTYEAHQNEGTPEHVAPPQPPEREPGQV